MIKGIHHASFTVSNMERSVRFYRDILGMEVLWDSVEAGAKFMGEKSDKITGCPGTEQHLVFMGIERDFLELVEYMPGGKALVDHKASDVGSGRPRLLSDGRHSSTLRKAFSEQCGYTLQSSKMGLKPGDVFS
jgi:catechol 2,3-dioxygenase-like lactoylglutathione lyase family enzyme